MTPLRPAAAHALLHVTVFIWGFTAVLGRAISIGALPLVWYRIGFTVVVMAGVVALRPHPRVTARQRRDWLVVGVLVALHWLLFYACIKSAGIAVAVLCLSAGTVFTALFEPVVFRRGPRPAELIIGALVVVGVGFLVKLETDTPLLGLAMGLGSAFFSAAFGTLNGKLAQSAAPEQVSLHELSSAFGVTTLFFALHPGDFVGPGSLSLRDFTLLLVLAVGCTVLPWMWSLRVLRTLRPYTVALAVTLEPVYSMVLAWFLFPDSEQLTWRFYLGAALLVALVVVNAWLKRPRSEPVVVSSP